MVVDVGVGLGLVVLMSVVGLGWVLRLRLGRGLLSMVLRVWCQKCRETTHMPEEHPTSTPRAGCRCWWPRWRRMILCHSWLLADVVIVKSSVLVRFDDAARDRRPGNSPRGKPHGLRWCPLCSTVRCVVSLPVS